MKGPTRRWILDFDTPVPEIDGTFENRRALSKGPRSEIRA